MTVPTPAPHIDDSRISQALAAGPGLVEPRQVREILQKAKELKGLSRDDVVPLLGVTDPELLGELFRTAGEVKQAIYGNRIVLFAPLYISNLCANECDYCAFRVSNRALDRRVLSQQEIAEEVRWLVDHGHKRLLMVAGEAMPHDGFDYYLKAIDTIYATRTERGEIRRVNVNLAPLEVEQFAALKARNIGTYQLFQETYHRPTYAQVHKFGRKADYDWRLGAIDRAMQAGIDDCGVGVLFGLHDWRYELLALMQHIDHLEDAWGVGPHTISMPRLEPADGSELASHPLAPLGDTDFLKLIAILRMAVPYTGLILSTRETPEIRRAAFRLGVSQISAGSVTNPGGYAHPENQVAGQFSLGDHRSLDEVVRDVLQLGFVPSFCTACYRLGRTGRDFMDLAKPGEIKTHCLPNALATLQEYLQDFAGADTLQAGELRIAEDLDVIDEPKLRRRAGRMVEAVRAGKHDVFC
jgi:2-iminoacetate synthase